MHQASHITLAPKTPMVNRNIPAWFGALMLCSAHGAMAQPRAPLTETDVASLARRASPLSAMASATDELAAARERTAGLRDNPSVAWDREAVPARAGGSQDIVRASIPIDLVGPSAVQGLQSARAADLRVDAQLLRDDAALQAVRLYHDLLFAKAQAAVLAAAVRDLDEATRILRRREAAGSSSGYERIRLQLAGELGRSRHTEALGEIDALRNALAELLGLSSADLVVAEAVAPMTVADAVALAGAGAAGRTTLRLAQRAQTLGADAEADAQLTWAPTLRLSGGLKHANAGGPDGAAFGYAVGLQLDLPVFDYGQAARAEARAQHALASARHQGLQRQARAQARAALSRYRAAHDELHRFDAQTSSHVDALLAAARAGYAEGERTIVELLDSQRTQTEIRLRQLALFRNAKQAEARLRAAVGDL